MLKDLIDIVGIQLPNNFPIITALDRYKQFTVEEILKIPQVKPDVEQIVQVMIEAKPVDYKVIPTPTGLKVIVNGILNQKVMYVADEPTQSVHTAEYIKDWCEFIEVPLIIPPGSNVLQLLKSVSVSLDTAIVMSPGVIVEDLSVRLIDPRTVAKCGILFIWIGLNPLLEPLLPKL